MSSPLFDSQKPEMLQILQKPRLQEMILMADLRERRAECSENSSDSSDSEWLLVVCDWLLASDQNRDMSAMSSSDAQASA